MARPFKQGLAYFPFDVTMFDDPKIRDVIIECGYLGVLVYIRILTLVYANGYYLETSVEKLSKVIFRDFRGPALRRADRVSEIIRSLAKCDLLDTRLMIDDVITSSSIQKQWLTSVPRRKNIDKSKYWLLSSLDEVSIKNFYDNCALSVSPDLVNVDNNLVNVCNNSVNDSNNTQKENKNKKEKKKDKKDKLDKRSLGYPKLHFVTECLVQSKYITDTDLRILDYDELIWGVADAYHTDVILSVVNYITKYAKRADPPIDDKFGFFRESLLRNCEMIQKRNEGGTVFGEEIDAFLEKLVKERGF